MAKKRKGRPVNGVLLFYKPKNMTSNFILQKLRWLYQAEKAGHGGTLDPFAEGLLPILFGEATKFGQYILGADKRYTVTIQFGRETSTDDSEGITTIEYPMPEIINIDWKNVLAHFRGEQQQIPPIYSALKIDGQRAYELARRGEEPQMAARPITIHEINLLAINTNNHTLTLDVHCSKGTYIRALARDIGRHIGNAAHACALIRTAVGNYNNTLTTLPDMEALHPNYHAMDAKLLPLESCVSHLPTLIIPTEKLRYIRNGNDIATTAPDGSYALFDAETFFGIGIANNGRLQPQRLCTLPTHQTN